MTIRPVAYALRWCLASARSQVHFLPTKTEGFVEFTLVLPNIMPPTREMFGADFSDPQSLNQPGTASMTAALKKPASDQMIAIDQNME
jgi:hypothetical protein